jgi:6-pyruvoyl-tetrahydropterin synthase
MLTDLLLLFYYYHGHNYVITITIFIPEIFIQDIHTVTDPNIVSKIQNVQPGW